MHFPNGSSRLPPNTLHLSSSSHLGTQVNPGMTPDRAFGICLGLVPLLSSSALLPSRCLSFCECPFLLPSSPSSPYCIKSQAFHDPLNYLAWTFRSESSLRTSQAQTRRDRQLQSWEASHRQQSTLQIPGFSARPGLAPSQLRQNSPHHSPRAS